MDGERLRDAMVRDQIEAPGVRDPRVLAAMRRVPRDRFVPRAERADSAVPVWNERPPAPGVVVELTVSSWEKVEQLCRRRERGAVHITAAIPHSDEDRPITVTLLLPDGFTLSVAGEVVTPEGSRSPMVALVGLNRHLAARLRALAGCAFSRPCPPS